MITVCILTKNAGATIGAALDSVRTFAEVILLDNGSTDQTVELARGYPNVVVMEAPFIGFGPLRNQVAKLASHDWILALDADEALSPSLLQELAHIALDPSCVYSIARKNYYRGRHIRGCGWHPDRVVRLYHRKTTSYSDAQVHESVIVGPLQTIRLKSPLLHTPFRDTADFLAKMQHYSSLFASQYAGKRHSSLLKALIKSLIAFIRSYFFKRGFLLGGEGFIISLYNSNTTFYKYLKLSELDKKSSSKIPNLLG